MTDTQKKVGLGVIVVIAVAAVIWEATTLFTNPAHPTKVINAGYSPGHTMKSGILAHEGK